MRLQKNISRIIRGLSYKYNIPYEDMVILVNSPFKFVKDIILSANRATRDLKSIRLRYFGIFYVSEARKDFLQELEKRLDKDGTISKLQSRDKG